jgi:hypothetical protein
LLKGKFERGLWFMGLWVYKVDKVYKVDEGL